MVSTRPRACSRRSVKMWPRSGSAQSWISSTATNSAARSSGMASTVQEIPARLGGNDFFFPGDQRDVLRPLGLDQPVVVLPREQAQGEADDAGGVSGQPLDREMRLAGVGGAEHGLHPRGESGHALMFGGGQRECKGVVGRGPHARRHARHPLPRGGKGDKGEREPTAAMSLLRPAPPPPWPAARARRPSVAAPWPPFPRSSGG